MNRLYRQITRIRRYRLRVFKRLPGTAGGFGIYGSKTYEGTLAQMTAKADKLAPRARCREIAPGRYAIEGAAARMELEVIA